MAHLLSTSRRQSLFLWSCLRSRNRHDPTVEGNTIYRRQQPAQRQIGKTCAGAPARGPAIDVRFSWGTLCIMTLVSMVACPRSQWKSPTRPTQGDSKGEVRRERTAGTTHSGHGGLSFRIHLQPPCGFLWWASPVPNVKRSRGRELVCCGAAWREEWGRGRQWQHRGAGSRAWSARRRTTESALDSLAAQEPGPSLGPTPLSWHTVSRQTNNTKASSPPESGGLSPCHALMASHS